MRRWFLVLWINLFGATCALAMFWRLTADPALQTYVLPAWVSAEIWLKIGLGLHLAAVGLLVTNLVCCVRFRADRNAAAKFAKSRRSLIA